MGIKVVIQVKEEVKELSQLKSKQQSLRKCKEAIFQNYLNVLPKHIPNEFKILIIYNVGFYSTKH